MLQIADARLIMRRQQERWQHWRRLEAPLSGADEAVRAAVAAESSCPLRLTESLVAYFWSTHQRAVDAQGTLADYAGWPSIYGARNDAIEGVSRLAPLWSACLRAELGSAPRRSEMAAHLRRMLVHGTDPKHPGYWGDIGERSTLICEAADIALALWIGRDVLWPILSIAERDLILGWLRQAVGRRTADNNWHLFVVLIDAVVAVLDPAHAFSSEARLRRVREFARSDGCFADGPEGQVDFYNAWGFHYLLYWLGEIDASLVGHGLGEALGEFCHWYQWLFTPQGIPLFGRSLCYRMATSAPLLSCAVRHPEVVSPGVAAAALLSTWRFFVSQGALRAGRPTQGVFGEDVRWLDPYSGPASSLWGTRSLVMVLYTKQYFDWAQVEPLPLPATLQDRALVVRGLGATLHTDKDRSECMVEFAKSTPHLRIPVRDRALRDHMRQAVHAVGVRPANNLRMAGEHRFSSRLEHYR